jgi:hypothetical protein
MAAQQFFLLNIGPFRASALLVAPHPLTELLIPNAGGSQVDRMGGQTQGHLFGESTFPGTLPACNEDDVCHEFE